MTWVWQSEGRSGQRPIAVGEERPCLVRMLRVVDVMMVRKYESRATKGRSDAEMPRAARLPQDRDSLAVDFDEHLPCTFQFTFAFIC
jgi:hypothetical protein